MEIGNMLFGNSIGKYRIERNQGFEEEFQRLFEAIHPTKDSSCLEFNNDTFSIFPYYWGECTCGFDDKDFHWKRKNSCQSDCFTVRYKQFDRELERQGISLFNEDTEDEWEARIEQFCKDNGLDSSEGAISHCTCGKYDEYNEWRKNHGHKSDCLLVKSNFHFKETDFSIKWYKYPLRDSYMNQNLTLKDFSNIVNTCIKSLK